MTEEAQRRRRISRGLWLVLIAIVLVLAVLLVPPMISIGRYKSRITQLVSRSLDRPVRLSSVELRLLPRPGFVLADLTVDEDPAFGAEPVLHAGTVTAAIQFSSLWRGHLAISRISVDEASLNLVRNADGRWNLDPLFRNAAVTRGNAAGQGSAPPLPYLEATDSRINIKDGLEKLPYSLVNADISFWQPNPGEWRLRLRGQPARTDVNLDLADTGIVRLEASVSRAPQLRQMPLHVEMEWKEAQLGQLSRLILGSDPGWRGDLTGNMQLDGTAESAQIKTRLTATGVHRAEFAPAEALDFDANCSFVYHYSGRAVENLACDSPLGDGHIKLTADQPSSSSGKVAVQLDRIPLSASLGVLRTLRNGIGDDLDARGTISGQLAYDSAAENVPPAPAHPHAARTQLAKNPSPPLGPLQGSLTIDGFRLSGNGLQQPIQFAKLSLAPAPFAPGQPAALTATLPLPAGGVTPLTIGVRMALSGYHITARGPAALPRLRELAHAAGVADTSAIDTLAGDPALLDLNVDGPWLPPPAASANLVASVVPALTISAVPADDTNADQLSGTVTLHNANWKSDALVNHVEISEAELHLGNGSIVWDPVAFTYGPVKGTASLQIALACETGSQCPPQLDLHFDSLDTTELQQALLGARQQGTVLSDLIARFSLASASPWPRFNGTIKADSLVLGPVTLDNASIVFRVLPTGAEFTSIDAGLLDGHLHLTGTLAGGDKPAYAFEGKFEKVSGPALCNLLVMRCTAGTVDGNGKLALSGFAAKDLASSATGTLHFDWLHGAIVADSASQLPKTLARFDHWSADAAIDHGAVTLQQNQVQQAGHKSTVAATITFADPPKVTFTSPKPLQTAKR